MSRLTTLIKIDALLLYRHATDIINPWLVFCLITILFSLAVGADFNLLRQIAAAVIVVAALLANLLTASRLFQEDYREGIFEQCLLSDLSFPFFCFMKLVIHWVVIGLPLIVIAPLLALMLGLQSDAYIILEYSLLLGTPILTIIGAMAAALTLSLRGQHFLLALMILPLYVPVLIFMTGAVNNAVIGVSVHTPLGLLAAMLCLGLCTVPFVVAAAIKININQ